MLTSHGSWEAQTVCRKTPYKPQTAYEYTHLFCEPSAADASCHFGHPHPLSGGSSYIISLGRGHVARLLPEGRVRDGLLCPCPERLVHGVDTNQTEPNGILKVGEYKPRAIGVVMVNFRSQLDRASGRPEQLGRLSRFWMILDETNI